MARSLNGTRTIHERSAYDRIRVYCFVLVFLKRLFRSGNTESSACVKLQCERFCYDRETVRATRATCWLSSHWTFRMTLRQTLKVLQRQNSKQLAVLCLLVCTYWVVNICVAATCRLWPPALQKPQALPESLSS